MRHWAGGDALDSAAMRTVVLAVVGALVVVALSFGGLVVAYRDATRRETPLEASRRFHTRLTRDLVEPASQYPVPVPDSIYQRVEYQGPTTKLWGWMTRPQEAQRRYPAIVWMVGGFPPGGLPNGAWLENDPANDQSAAQYMRAGVITLYPTTRGMEGNAGTQQSFLGEVEDVVAAVQWLRAQPSVDPERVFVGGHSTGGTLALLVGASTPVAGVISSGPVDDVCNYGPGPLAFDSRSREECAVRAPLTYARQLPRAVIVEGAWSPNADAVRMLSRAPSKNVSYVLIPNDDHFSHLGAINELLAQKLSRNEALTLSVEEAVAVMERAFPPTVVESPDGWRLTVPAGYSERTGEGPVGTERYFKNPLATLLVSLQEEQPVTCEEPGAIKGRAGECFRSSSERDEDGTELLLVTAQRGSALFVTVVGLKSQRATLLAELNAVVQTAKAPPAGH